MLLTRTNSRAANHCWVRATRAGCRAMMVIPNANLPSRRMAKAGAQPCRNRAAVDNVSVTAVSALGPNLEVHQVIGRARVMFPQKAAEPNSPCLDGDRWRSALIEGSRIPTVERTMNPETLATIHRPTTNQR